MTRLVLVPPLGHDHHVYDALVGALGSAVDVRTIDYPGFGDDASFDWDDANLLDRLAGHLAVRIEALAPEWIGGISLGGTLATPIWHRLARKPLGLVLMASGGLPVASVRRAMIGDALRRMDPFEFARVHLGADAELDDSPLRPHFVAISEAARAYWRHYLDVVWAPQVRPARAFAAARMLAAAVEVDYGEAMGRLDAQALLVWGEADRVFGVRHMHRLAAALPRSRCSVIPAVGHYAPLEAPEAVARALLDALGEGRRGYTGGERPETD